MVVKWPDIWLLPTCLITLDQDLPVRSCEINRLLIALNKLVHTNSK